MSATLLTIVIPAYALVGLAIAEPMLRSDAYGRFAVGGPDPLAAAIIALFWPLVVPAFAADSLHSAYLICKRRGRGASARELKSTWRRK